MEVEYIFSHEGLPQVGAQFTVTNVTLNKDNTVTVLLELKPEPRFKIGEKVVYIHNTNIVSIIYNIEREENIYLYRTQDIYNNSIYTMLEEELDYYVTEN